MRNEYGQPVGWLDKYESGNIVARNKFGKIIGKYTKNDNYTRDVYGRPIAKGNILSALIWREQ